MLLGINTPKAEQEKTILQFLLGRDVFVALPTGYGIACATSFYRWYLTELGVCAIDRYSREPSALYWTTD